MKTVILDWATVAMNGDISPDCFKNLGEVICYDYTSPCDVAERIKEADAVLCNKTPITSDTIENCPSLKYIGLFATGYNNIDIPKTVEKNIPVCNAGSYSTNAVAQQVFAYILSFYSRVNEYDSAVKNGEWIRSPFFSYFPIPTQEIYGKTLAVIGYGSIGKSVAEIGCAFGMNVIVSTRTTPKNCKFECVSVDDAFRLADVLTVHCPLTEKTEGMICKKRLKTMKPSAIVINTARGGIVVESDLAYALNNDIISGAAVDVLAKEPMSENTPLKNAKNCIVTSHIAWAAYETRKRLVSIVYDNIKAFSEGKIQIK